MCNSSTIFPSVSECRKATPLPVATVAHRDGGLFFMGKLIDLTGLKYGRLTVLSRSANNGTKTEWKCLCECGETAIVEGWYLRSGHTKSCGCLISMVLRERNTTHGERYSPEYDIWCSMKARCTNPNQVSWGIYGGRGITFCERWVSFKNFLSDMGRRPYSGATIDRIDNSKGYRPDNCRWTDRTSQANNRRSNRFLTLDGKTQTISLWSKEYLIRDGCLRARIKRGWSTDRALKTPVVVGSNQHTKLKI